VADIVGLHHLSLPASDCVISSDWYERVLGFSRVLIEEEEDVVSTVAVQHDCDVLIYLRLDRRGIQAADGTADHGPALSFRVPSRADLDSWDERLTTLGVEHSAPHEVHLGWAVDVAGPDGLLIQLHTRERLSADPD
jgi:catechol 2,3-dioxygenase-like lactoylglutathione lyase family enzyme